MASITGQDFLSAASKYENLLLSVGKRVINAQFPDDFEFYMVALELIDSKENTIEYFIFPINPSGITEVKIPLVNIKKTAGGVTVMSTQTFVPTDITLTGNFGRKFKFLLGRELINFSAIKQSAKNILGNVFSDTIKTGYGCTKVLERIIMKSSQLDDFGKPHSLYLYNLGIGNNYLVKCTSLNLQQDLGSNMIWNYNVQFKSLIKAENVERKSTKSLTKSLSFNEAIQGGINSLSNGIGAFLKRKAGSSFNI